MACRSARDLVYRYLKDVNANCYCAFRERFLRRTFLSFHSPMLYFNLKPDFIPMLLQNNLTASQLFVIILNV